MPSQISLADFNRIASGTYNAGQVDIATALDGTQSLVKVNNHVWFTSRNNVQLSPVHVLAVKETFIAALQNAGVQPEQIAAIREELGMPVGLDATGDDARADVDTLVEKRFTPLTREKVRTILDTYANGGRGFTDQSRAAVTEKEDEASLNTALADATTVARRDAANAMAQTSGDPVARQNLKDALSFVFGAKLEDVGTAGRNLSQAFREFFVNALRFLIGDVCEFTFLDTDTKLGTDAKFVPGNDGSVSVAFGSGPLKTTVKVADSKDAFLDKLFSRALAEFETLDGYTRSVLLTKLGYADSQRGVLSYNKTSYDPSSWQRQFAAKMLERAAAGTAAGAPAFSADDLIYGSTYDTRTLTELARQTIDNDAHATAKALNSLDVVSFLSGGKALADTNAARGGSAGLPNEFKELFAQARKLCSDGVNQSAEFTFCGHKMQLVKDKADQTLSVLFREESLPIFDSGTAKLGVDAQAFVERLTRCAAGEIATLGSPVVESILKEVLDVPSRASNGRASPYDVSTLILIAQQGAAESLDSMDELAFLLGERTLTDINEARGQRDGRDPGAETAKLRNTFKGLFSGALQLLPPADVKESGTFTFCGCPAKIVKGDDLKLSIVFVTPSKTGRFNLGVDARAFADRLVTCAVDDAGTLEGPLMKELLATALKSDGADLVASADPSSLGRLFSAKILADCARHAEPRASLAFKAGKLVSGQHSTGILAQFAQQALDGKVDDALAAMDELMFLSGEKPLAEVNAACVRRDGGKPGEATGTLGNGFKELLLKTLQLPSAGAAESDTFTFCGHPAKIVRSAEGDNLSVCLGDPVVETVALGVDARTFVNQLVARALDGSVTLDAATTKEILTAVARSEEANGISPANPSSLARQLSMKVIAACVQRAAPDAPAFTVGEFSSRDRYGTNVLVQVAQMALDGEDDKALGMLDALSFFYGEKKLADINAARGGRVGKDADEEVGKLRNGFKELFAKALQLPPGGATESVSFTFWGAPAKIVRGEDGSLSVGLGNPTATMVGQGADVERFVGLLIDRALDASETLGAPTMKDMLTLVVNRDVANRISYNDHVSLTRQFAANILAGYAKRDAAGMPAFTANALVSGNYQTMVLAHIAQKALEGAKAENFSTLESLSRMHEALKQDSAGLSKEMKDLLTPVKDIPLTKPKGSSCEFVVTKGDEPQPPENQAERIGRITRAASGLSLGGIGGIKGIKDFIADFVFSDETMLADVTPRLPGETMREILSDENKLFALAQIIKDQTLIQKAVSPEIADVVIDGFNQLIVILDDAFKAANGGESLTAAAQKDDFVGRFAEFFMNPSQLSSEKLAQFDAIILAMSTTGCERLQDHVNGVFKLDANEAGMVTGDPYKEMSGNQIAAALHGESLNDIIDVTTASAVPGQVGLFKQVLLDYFTQLRPADKRSAFAASLRYAETFESGETQEARKAFTGAILKGAGPILQKMMQGLPKEMLGEFSSVLDDMRAHLAPIPRKVVQAYLMQMVKDPNSMIESITLVQSLGAASVGEAFLCQFKVKGNIRTQQCVVKIMRHDAEARVIEEGKIVAAAAEKIPGMAKTWAGQFEQYLTEFDFRTEAKNAECGVSLYDVKGGGLKVPVPKAKSSKIADERAEANRATLVGGAQSVASMKMSPLVKPQKNVMVAECANGKTMDAWFKQWTAELREVAAGVFKVEGGHVLWQDVVNPRTRKPVVDPVTKERVKAPVFREGAVSPAYAAYFTRKFMDRYTVLRDAAKCLQEATRVWFYQAILGNGQFHGDLHAGNLMHREAGDRITFIDFGNLYTLQAKREDGVNEQEELLRVIFGATFGKRDYFLAGFEKLMSPAGKRALANPVTRDKAVKILDEVLQKGGFSRDIVYRLQAAVVELQKLGLELPPPINCFILSLVRLSNTVAEITSIINQCRVMVDALDSIKPAPRRDALDLAGRAFDAFARATSGPAKDKEGRIMAVADQFLSHEVDGVSITDATFRPPNGSYYKEVVKRLNDAQDKGAAAEKLVTILSQHNKGLLPGSRDSMQSYLGGLDQLVNEFRAKCKPGSTPAEQADAIGKFAQEFAMREFRCVKDIMQNLGEFRVPSDHGGIRKVKTIEPPPAFASAIMDVIRDFVDDICAPFAAKEPGFAQKFQDEFLGKLGYTETTLKAEVAARTLKEKITGRWKAVDPEEMAMDLIRKALQRDAANRGGDTSYKIDIGI